MTCNIPSQNLNFTGYYVNGLIKWKGKEMSFYSVLVL